MIYACILNVCCIFTPIHHPYIYAELHFCSSHNQDAQAGVSIALCQGYRKQALRNTMAVFGKVWNLSCKLKGGVWIDLDCSAEGLGMGQGAFPGSIFGRRWQELFPIKLFSTMVAEEGSQNSTLCCLK